MGVNFKDQGDFRRMAEAVKAVERSSLAPFGDTDDQSSDVPPVHIVQVTAVAAGGRKKYTGKFLRSPQQTIKFYNLSETSGGSASLAADDFVMVTPVDSEYLKTLAADTPGDYENWGCVSSTSLAIFPCKITAEGSVDSSKRYIATIVEQTLTGSAGGGYGQWAAKAGGRTGNAYNMWEDNNDGAGIIGSGFNIAHLPSGFTLQPVTTNLITLAMETTLSTGSKQYWLIGPQWPDGSCATTTTDEKDEAEGLVTMNSTGMAGSSYVGSGGYGLRLGVDL